MAPVSDSDERDPLRRGAARSCSTATRGFSPELGEAAGDVLRERVHRRPAAARQARAARSAPTPCPSAHPYVLLNYTSRPHDVLTMAHELGHGVHASLARPQGIFHFTTPLTLAETASIFGETIVLERLLERAPGPAEPPRPAGGLARRRRGRGVPPGRDEPLRARGPHASAASAASCRVDRFGELWLETQADLLGDSVELDDDYGVWWSYVWHFVDTPGYVYAYAYGHLLALSVYRRYEEAGRRTSCPPTSTCSAPAARCRRRSSGRSSAWTCRTPGFWSSGLDLIERQLEAAEARGARGGGRLSGSSRSIDAVSERIALPGGEIEVTRPRDAEALLSARSRSSARSSSPTGPSSGRAAWRSPTTSSMRSLRGRRTLELGCGLGAAEHRRGARRRARAGHATGRPTACAPPPPTPSATAWRSRRCVCAWARARRRSLERAPWHLVLASDVLYERRNVDLLLDAAAPPRGRARPRAASPTRAARRRSASWSRPRRLRREHHDEPPRAAVSIRLRRAARQAPPSAG